MAKRNLRKSAVLDLVGAINRGEDPFASSSSGGSRRGDKIKDVDTNPRAEYSDPSGSSDPLLNDSSYLSQFLGTIGQNVSGDSLINLLLQIARGNLDKAGTADDDLQNELVKMVLTQLVTQEQRSYDMSALAEQRSYDHPLNKLLRLMSTGMSRDAALQAINGETQDPALVGSGSDVTAGENLPSPSQRALDTVNSVFGAISAVGSLVSVGFSLAEAIPQVKMLRTAQFMSDEQKQSYNNVKSVTKELGRLANAGFVSFEGLSNLTDLEGYLSNTAKSDINVQSLIGSPAYKDAFSTPFGRTTLNNWWKSVRESGKEGTLYDNFVDSTILDNRIRQMDINKAAAEISLIGTQEDLVSQQIITEVYNAVEKQVGALKAQTEYNILSRSADALVDLNFSNAKEARANAGMAQQMFELNDAGFPMLKQVYMEDLSRQLFDLYLENDPRSRDQKVKAYTFTQEGAAATAYLDAITANAVGDFAQNHPKLWDLCMTWKTLKKGYSFAEGAKFSNNSQNFVNPAFAAKAAKVLLTKKP